MFDRIIRFALRNRSLVMAAAILLTVYGAIVIRAMPVDVFPDLNRPTVTVMTEAGGLSPEEVEVLVTRPIETALNGAPGVQRIRSTSGIGLSVITVEFAWGMEIMRARHMTQERLQLAGEQLPAGVVPTMGPVASIMGEILLVGLYTDGSGESQPMDLRSLADWSLRPQLLAIPGVAQVIAIGGGVKQYQVLVSPTKLAAAGVSLDEVEQAAGLSQTSTTGGFVDRKSQEYLVRNLARSASLDELRDTVITVRQGLPITLGQVAEVTLAPRTRRGDAGVGIKDPATGVAQVQPAVILSIQKQPGADTVALTGQIEQALREASGTTLPADVKAKVLFRQASFIHASVSNVAEALRDGAILVVIVLFVFLLNFRTTFITLTAIPLSFVVTAVVLQAMGLSINTMTLGGLAVAIGELVDDAIVDVENVFRRLEENRRLPEKDRLPAVVVVFRASSEVRSSIVFATVVVILVFIPLFAMSGIEGRLFAPLGVAYIVAILASLLVSLTITPVLSYYLLRRSKPKVHSDGPLVRFLKARQRSLLSRALHHPYKVMAGAAVLVVAAAAVVPQLGREFLPPFNEGTVTINLLAVPGTSLSESDRIGALAERLILQVPEAVSTGRRTGRAELDEHAEGVHYSEIDVDLRASDRTREEVLADLRARLGQLPGVVVNIGQPISHRLDHLLSGVRAQIAVKLFGDDLAALRDKANQVHAAISGVPGAVDVQIEKQVLIPQILVSIRPDQARKYGLQPGLLAHRLETALAGTVVGQVLDGQKTHDIIVRFDDASRLDLTALGDALIDTPSGKVPLRILAEVIEGAGPNQIVRENGQRRIVVSANVSGRDLAAVVGDIQAAVRDHVDTRGTLIQYGGQFESQQAATRLITILALISLALIFIVLYSHFRDWRLVAQVLVNIPLALIGAVAALLLTHGSLSVATLIGFITLCGIASRNTIMMISHYIHLVKVEGEQLDERMVIRGSLERLVPVLMTAFTAGLALIPLVLSRGQAGKEILYPVAVVILGGLTSATLLDLVVTPVMFMKFGRPALARLLAAPPDPLHVHAQEDSHA